MQKFESICNKKKQLPPPKDEKKTQKSTTKNCNFHTVRKSCVTSKLCIEKISSD